MMRSSLSLSQDDDDGHLLALQIIRDLVDKGGDVFLDQLARLGVINKVSTLAGPASDDENEDEAKPEKVLKALFHLSLVQLEFGLIYHERV